MPAELYTLSTIFCPNESEAQLLTGIAVTDYASAALAARELKSRGAQTVIITLGALGSYVLSETEEFHVAADKVKVVDSSGAGDSFIGSLAYFMSEMPGLSLQESVKRAGYIASLSVQKQGTQASYPSRDSLPASLFQASPFQTPSN